MINPRYYLEKNIQYLIIESKNIVDYVLFINKNNIQNVVIDSDDGYNLEDISFLSSCIEIRRLIIVDSNQKINKSNIVVLKNLEYLISDTNNIEPIEINRLNKLLFLSTDFHKNWIGLNELISLETLMLWKVNKDSFLVNSKLYNLKYIKLINSRLKTIDGIQKLNSLEELELINNSKLKTVAFTCEMAYLKRIYINNCKSLSNISGLEHLPNLEILVISDCKCIESCNFLQSAKEKLSRVVIRGTKVLDDSFDLVKKFKEHKYEQGRIEISNF